MKRLTAGDWTKIMGPILFLLSCVAMYFFMEVKTIEKIVISAIFLWPAFMLAGWIIAVYEGGGEES